MKARILVAALLMLCVCPAGASAQRLQVYGDSLAVGTHPLLAAALPAWRVTTDARVGRHLSQGMAIYSHASVHSRVVGMSLFTNDDPMQFGQLKAAVRTTYRDAAARQGCVIWATIVRPSGDYSGVNRWLRTYATARTSRVLIVDWAAAVRAHPQLVGADGVHGTLAGYRWRAREYARLARSC